MEMEMQRISGTLVAWNFAQDNRQDKVTLAVYLYDKPKDSLLRSPLFNN